MKLVQFQLCLLFPWHSYMLKSNSIVTQEVARLLYNPMPEVPEVLVWEKLLKRRKLTNFLCVYILFIQLIYHWVILLVYLVISPLAFSLGLEKREYITLMANQSQSQQVEAQELPHWISSQHGSLHWPPQSWWNQAVNENWAYLLDDTPPGQLIVGESYLLLHVVMWVDFFSLFQSLQVGTESRDKITRYGDKLRSWSPPSYHDSWSILGNYHPWHSWVKSR